MPMVAERSVKSVEKVQIQPLVKSALMGLGRMFYPERKLFCYRFKRTLNGMEREGVSHRYTLITLKGLLKAESVGLRSPIDVRTVLAELDRDLAWITSAGDLGLYLWLCALASPDRLSGVTTKLDVNDALDRYPDTRERQTMALAWFLSGLAHIRLAKQSGIPDFTDLAFKTYRLLKGNQGTHGFFGHLPTNGSYAGLLRGRIGSFADQVYPIYGLSKFALAFGAGDALQSAVMCANAICRAQGPLGQWWWHYDSATGKVIGKYPVYSVHQEGMAPMALFAMSDASRENYSRPIFRGLEWIAGRNELNLDMRDDSDSLVWRSLQQSKYKAYRNEILSLLKLPGARDTLRVKYECRPYELGWLLYAFAPSLAKS